MNKIQIKHTHGFKSYKNCIISKDIIPSCSGAQSLYTVGRQTTGHQLADEGLVS